MLHVEGLYLRRGSNEVLHDIHLQLPPGQVVGVLGPNGAMTTQEIIQGVQTMNLTYLLPGANAYVAADAVPAARWGEVAAVRIELTLQGAENVDGAPITRQLVQVANLRNRSL